MKPALFDYVRPSSVEDALQALATLQGAKILAGGQSLVPMLNMRFVQPDYVLDISRLELSYIELRNGNICIGATTPQRDLELSPLVKSHAPLIAEALKHVGHVQTRNRGTIGGSLCHLDPAAELPAVCISMDGDVVLRSAARGERVVPMRSFPVAFMTSLIEPDELMTEIRLPVWPEGHGYAVQEFSRRRGDFAIAAAFVLIAIARQSVIRASITIAGLGSAPARIPASEQLLIGENYRQINLDEAARLCGELEATSDVHASAKYRQQLARVMASRSLKLAVERARKELV